MATRPTSLRRSRRPNGPRGTLLGACAFVHDEDGRIATVSIRRVASRFTIEVSPATRLRHLRAGPLSLPEVADRLEQAIGALQREGFRLVEPSDLRAEMASLKVLALLFRRGASRRVA